jgi:hypothetical protein
MEVVKRGIDPEDIPWVGTRSNCNSELKAARYEVNGIERCVREDIEHGKADCPVCGASVSFHQEPVAING